MMTFATAEYAAYYPELEAYPGHVAFPQPFTFGDYKKWFRLALPSNRNLAQLPDPFELLMQQYKAAFAIVAEWEIENCTRQEADPNANSEDALSMALVSFLADAADDLIGPRIVVETLPALEARRAAAPPHPSATFTTDEFIDLLPPLAEYAGSSITFAASLTAGLYRSWTKEVAIHPKSDPRDIRNSPLARQYRGALPLIDKWDVAGVERGLLTGQGDRVPLVIVSWLVECVDIYLGARLNQKKLRRMSATGS